MDYLKEQATEILAPYSCRAQIKKYKPSTLPALYMRNDAMQIVKNAEENQPLQNAIWQKITGDVVNNFKAHAKAEIYFNFNNDTIQLLNTIKDPKILRTYIELFYCQALLMGRYHLSVEELQAFNTNFQTLLNQSLT